MRSVSFSNETFAFSWMRVLSRPNEYLSSMKGFWYQLECWRRLSRDCGFEGEILTESSWILLVAAQNLSIRCRTSWINLCTSLFLSSQLAFFECWLDFTFFKELVFWIYHGSSWSSTYHYISLQNDRTGKGQLQIYFLGESMVISLFYFVPKICWICLFWMQHGAGAIDFTANMYLAEDCILCSEPSLRGVNHNSCTMWSRRTYYARIYQIKLVSFVAFIT